MTNADAAHKITRAHQSRKAVVYLRQSSLAQVRRNTESQRLQYALAETAKRYGFSHSRAVKRVVGVHWKEELGLPEAMWVLEVENFGPFIVDGDCTGASLAALAIEKVNPNFAREYAKLPDHVLKRIGEIDRTLRHEVIVGKPERK